MSVFSFFEEEKKEITEEIAPQEKSAETDSKPEEQNRRRTSPVAKHVHEVGGDMEKVFLLDASYDSQENKALLTFYDPETKSIYRWKDNTDHMPYLITTLQERDILEIPEVTNNKNFKGVEEVTKLDPYAQVQKSYRRVYGLTPLEIGGNYNSFREFINPSYEADIRYHLNFLADRGITPASYYTVRDGKLIPHLPDLDEATVEELEEEFAEESTEEKEMLDEYMPVLFQDMPDILRAAYDIEVGSPKNVLPNTTKADFPIISIALVDSEERKFFWYLERQETKGSVMGHEDVEVRGFGDEAMLLEDFFEVINSYPMVLSFNGDNFDNPYLINRAKKLGLEHIPLIQKRGFTTFEDSLHLDLHVFFRQPAIRLYAFGGAYDKASLDDISRGLLGEGKLEHPDVWINDMDLPTLLKYNVLDTELTLDLTRYNNQLVMNLIFILMRISKMPFIDFTRQTVSSWIKFWLIWEHRKRSILIPTKDDIAFYSGGGQSSAIIEGKKFQGAIVIDPMPGIWWDVQVWDFASLYPSVIKTRNLSYETINCNHEECRTNQVPELSHWVCTKIVGIMSLMIGFVRDVRVKYFKPRKRQQKQFAVIEQALKVLINAGYGVIGSQAFDFYCLPVAESTTAFARDAITSIRNYVTEELGLKVLYGDTDSVFIHQPTEEDVEKVVKWSIENLGIEIGQDYDFRYAVFSDRKKNYLGVTKSGGAVVKGLVGKKKNTPNIVRRYFSSILDELVKVEKDEDFEVAKSNIIAMVKELKRKVELNELTPEDVMVQTTLTGRVKDYTTWTQPIQALAQLLEANYPGADQIDVGDVISYVPVEGKVNVKITGTRLAFPTGSVKQASVKPVELVSGDEVLGRNVLDIAQTAFSQILEPLGIDWERDIVGQQSLDDWF